MVPHLMFTRHDLQVKNTLATWLMPIVPPMVSAATRAALIARQHLPFSLTWWSFTFPVGTLVTGTSELAIHTGHYAAGCSFPCHHQPGSARRDRLTSATLVATRNWMLASSAL